MKRFYIALYVLAMLLASCAGQRTKVMFHPDPVDDSAQPVIREAWQIIESQSGANGAIPEWVGLYLEGESRKNSYTRIETLGNMAGKYVFIGDNRGGNINILNQWANGFSPAYDLPRLVAQRVERKLIAAATLYPDDEYGEYYVSMIRKVSDGEFSGAVNEQVFWVKRRLILPENESENEFTAADPTATERYEIFILISIDRDTLQRQLREIMAEARSSVSVNRDQSAAITRVQNTFFEGF